MLLAMSKRATVRRRCPECRCWFVPAAKVAKQQRVCSEDCRRQRRRKQARRRRRLEPARYREEEQERQRRRRERQRRGAQPVRDGARHAPGEADKGSRSRDKERVDWDELIEQSRAELERQVRRIIHEVERKMRQAPVAIAAGHAPR